MPETAVRALALLGSTTARSRSLSAHESSAARTGPPDQRDAEAIGRQLRLAAGGTGIDGAAGGDSDAHLASLAASLVDEARAVVTALEGGASPGSLSDSQRVALESVIRTRGRPALVVEDEGLEALDDARHPGSGFWRIPVGDHEVQLMRVVTASGAVMVRDRINGGAPIVVGTAWLIAGDRVVTNRHVLLPPFGTALVDRKPNAPTEAELKAGLELVVDFAHHRGATQNGTVAVAGVPYVAEAADPVDIAIIRLAADTGRTPLTLASAAAVSRQLFLVGHPGFLVAVPKEVQAVFGTPDGRKRVCLGEVLPDGASAGEIAHDASTIGGFSGACVQAFGGTGVSALHFYGDPARGNRAVTSDALRAHPAASFF
jgi:hypothetical protein